MMASKSTFRARRPSGRLFATTLGCIWMLLAIVGGSVAEDFAIHPEMIDAFAAGRSGPDFRLHRGRDQGLRPGHLQSPYLVESELANILQVAMEAPVEDLRRSTFEDALESEQVELEPLVPLDSVWPSADKLYNLTILFAGEYDSNVRLRPEFTGLTSTNDNHDYRIFMSSFLDLQLLSTDLLNLGLIGSTFNTFQFEANEFNIQDYMGGAYFNRQLLRDLVGSIRYEFHHTLVDEREFAYEHRLTPSLTWLGSRGHTTLFYEFDPIDIRTPGASPSLDQSGETHRVGITQAIYTWGGIGRVYLGYQYADTGADGSDFDRTAHSPNLRWEQPLLWTSIFDVDVRYVWDDYDNPNSLDFLLRPRDDQRVELRAGLQKNFDRPVSLRLDYTYIDNHSNTRNFSGVRLYRYDRHILSTQLIFSL